MITGTTPFGVNKETLGTFLSININGVFLEKASQRPEVGGKNIFNGIEINPKADFGYYKDLNFEEGKILFGKNLKLTLNRGARRITEGGDTVANFNGNYVPNIFYSTNNFSDRVVDENSLYTSGVTLKPNYTFSWNEDPNNNNGVFVYIEYDPKDPSNESFANAYPVHLSNAIIVEDNGTYTLSSELFDDFPVNSRLRVYMGRGNYGFITALDGSTSNMTMTALSYQFGEFFYKL
jgi:hypothetical protein